MLNKSSALRNLLNIPVEAGKCRLSARTDAPADVPLLKPWIVLTTQQEDEPFVTVSEIREALKEGGAEAVAKLCDELEGKDIKPLEAYA